LKNNYRFVLKGKNKNYYYYYKKNIDLTWRLESIVIFINLGLTFPSRPKKLGVRKGYMTQVAREWSGVDLKSLGSCIPTWSKTLGSGFRNQGKWVRRPGPTLMDSTLLLEPRLLRLTFKSSPNLLYLMLQLDPLKVG
jgi:hypothetical protein